MGISIAALGDKSSRSQLLCSKPSLIIHLAVSAALGGLSALSCVPEATHVVAFRK